MVFFFLVVYKSFKSQTNYLMKNGCRHLKNFQMVTLTPQMSFLHGSQIKIETQSYSCPPRVFTARASSPSLLTNTSTSSCAIPGKYTQHPASTAFRGRFRSGGRRSAAMHPLRIVPTAVVARALRLQPETYVSRVAAITICNFFRVQH